MNILYIHTHDTGRYIEPYGHKVATPHLMELAREGTLFRNAYNAGPTCSPSRAGLLTGMAPHSCGMLGLAHRGFELNDYGKHLAQFLNGHGYETALCGIQHVAPRSDMIGYGRILDAGDLKPVSARSRHETDIHNARLAADYLRAAKDKPFFLSFGMFSTHRAFPDIDPAIHPDYVLPPFPMADSDPNRRDMAAFLSSVMIADRCAGMVLDALRESGLEDDTFVIFTTDHGIAFPGMKCTLYDTGIGVSLIVKFPGNRRAGRASDALVSHLDLFPTLCDAVGAPHPPWLQGVSMMPYLRGEAETVRDAIFSEVTYHAAYEPMRCIRTDRYKYIRFFDDHDGYVPANMDDGFSKGYVAEHGYFRRQRDWEQLFDLVLDPMERVNLVDDPAYGEVAGELRDRLAGWMTDTGDPLLAGPVPMPQGAVVNTRTCMSPNDKDYVE